MQPPISVKADGVLILRRGLTTFKGNVEIRQGDRTFRADERLCRAGMEISHPGTNKSRWRRLVLEGNVVVTTPQETQRFQHLDIKVEDQRLRFGQASSPRPRRRRRAQAPPPRITDIGVVITDDKGQAPPIDIQGARVGRSPGGFPTLFEGSVVAQQGEVMSRADAIRVELAPSVSARHTRPDDAPDGRAAMSS